METLQIDQIIISTYYHAYYFPFFIINKALVVGAELEWGLLNAIKL